MEVESDAVLLLVDDGVVEVDFTRVFLIAHRFRPFRPRVHVGKMNEIRGNQRSSRYNLR